MVISSSGAVSKVKSRFLSVLRAREARAQCFLITEVLDALL